MIKNISFLSTTSTLDKEKSIFHVHLEQPKVIRCFQCFLSPFLFWCTCFFVFCYFVPMIIVIAINSICVPRCFPRAAATLALQETNIHRRQAQSGRPLMRGGSLPISCAAVLKSLHREVINFLCIQRPCLFEKDKDCPPARVAAPLGGSTHPLRCHLLCSHHFSLPFSVTPPPHPPQPVTPPPVPMQSSFLHMPVSRVIRTAVIKERLNPEVPAD